MNGYVVLFVLAIAVATYPGMSSACETSSVEIRGNLDSAAPEVDPLPAWNSTVGAQLSAAQAAVAVDVYDSLAVRHVLHVVFYNGATNWVVRTFVDGSEVGGTPGQSFHLDEQDLVFDASGEFPGSGVRVPLPWRVPWANGAKGGSITLALRLTKHASDSTLSAIQDGTTVACTQRGHLDFDGDGADDLVVWRRQYGMWAVLLSSTRYTQYLWKQWGLPGDYPMPGDYTGDGKTDLVVWRPASGNWYMCLSESQFDCSTGSVWQFGLPGDRPIGSDFDGDGILDFAVWRPTLGTFFYRSSRTSEVAMKQWGLPEDIPFNAGVAR